MSKVPSNMSQDQNAALGALPKRPTELLSACERDLIKHLLTYITPAFEDTDKALFDQAAKAASTEGQNRLFEAMNTIKGKKTLFTEALSEQITAAFADFIKGAPEPEDHGLTFGHNEMSLVEEQDLEEGLAITQMVSKAEIRNTQAIYALNQRFSVLNRGLPVKNDTNPCGPLKLGRAIRKAAECIEVPSGPKVLLFNALDRQIHAQISTCYEELNKRLIEAGVLPNLKFEKPAKPARRAPPRGSEGSEPDSPQPAMDPVSNTPELDFFGRATQGVADASGLPQNATDAGLVQDIRQMLSEIAGPAAQVPPAGVSFAPPPALQTALSSLQSQLAMPGPEQVAELLSAAEIKQLVRKALGTDPTGRPMALANHHAQTIDIMGMLYDHIQQENLLHEPVQQLLHRLQLPMIRVALQEESFFEEREHPARQFFNTIADAGELWLEDEPQESPTFQKMQVAVDRILTDYQDDLNVFKELIGDLDKHIGTLSKKAKLAEKRQVERARGQEKLELAREQARNEMERLIKKYQPPRFVESVLEHPWTDFMALTALRYGDEGEQWKEARKVAKTLIFSVRKGLSESVKMKLRSKVSWLTQKLSHGLSQVGYFEQDVKVVLGNLETCHRWSLAPKKRKKKVAQPALRSGPGRTARPSAPAADPPAPAETGPPETGEAATPEWADADPPASAEPPAPAATEPAAEPTEEPAETPEGVDDAPGSEDVAAMAEAEPEPPAVLHEPAPRSEAGSKLAEPSVKPVKLAELTADQKHNLAKVRLMAFGTWFELKLGDNQNWIKRKLSWYSPVTGRCLFVNNRGGMAEELNLHDLAIAMSEDRARVFEANARPLMDRAFESIFTRLKGLVTKKSTA
ncbi:MAG: DUF1631 family protein [Pseudomonadota bacterium]